MVYLLKKKNEYNLVLILFSGSWYRNSRLNFLDYRIRTLEASKFQTFSTIANAEAGVSAMSFDTVENRLFVFFDYMA